MFGVMYRRVAWTSKLCFYSLYVKRFSKESIKLTHFLYHISYERTAFDAPD